LVLDGTSVEVIGVMAPDFGYPGADMQLWVPHTLFGDWEAQAGRRGTDAWRVIGRLRAGVTLDAARADLRLVADALAQEHADNAGLGILAVPLYEQQTGATDRAALWMLYAAVGLVLLIACANAAHLMLIRSQDRSLDRAIRAALGASRLRLVRQALAENLSIALLAGLVGSVLAIAGVGLLRALGPPDVLPADVQVGPATLWYVAGLASLIGVAFGMAPALGRTHPALDLTGARVLSPGPGRRRGRHALIAVQLALALVLVFSASLLVRSLLESAAVDPGFEPEGVLMANLSVPSPEAQRAFYAGAVESVEGIAGVQAAGIIEDIFIGGAPSLEITVDGASGARAERIPIRIDAIDGDLFTTIGVPLLAGRVFTSVDGADATPVAIVNETLARRFWPGESPLGRRFHTGGASSGAPWVEVVGVVGDMRRQGVEREPIAQVFRPYAQAPSRNMNLLVRSDVPPMVITARLRERLAALDRTIPVYGVAALADGMDRYVAPRRLRTFLLGVFSSVALIMAGVGIYALQHHSIARRTREIGVRVALGARSADVARMVLREGLTLAVPGIAFGLLGAVWAAELLTALLYDVSAADPISIVLTGATLIGATLLASYLPARRAAAVDPNRALRGD
jgi:predicted permease